MRTPEISSCSGWAEALREDLSGLRAELDVVELACSTIDAERVTSELAPAVQALLCGADMLMDRILELARDPTRDGNVGPASSTAWLPFEAALDAIVASPARTREKLIEIALAVRLEVYERLARIARVSSPSAMFAECVIASNRLRKTFAALDAITTAVPPRRVSIIPAAQAFRTAAALEDLHDDIGRLNEHGALHVRLRHAAARLDELVHSPVYADLPLDDRIAIRCVRMRIADWLSRDDEREQRALEALSTWCALVDLVSLLDRR